MLLVLWTRLEEYCVWGWATTWQHDMLDDFKQICGITYQYLSQLVEKCVEAWILCSD